MNDPEIRELDLTKVRLENRPELTKLSGYSRQLRAWRTRDLVNVTANLTEAYMRRDGMWGVRLKGKTVLTEYDNTAEARAETGARR